MHNIGTNPNYDAHDDGAVSAPIIGVRTATVNHGSRHE